MSPIKWLYWAMAAQPGSDEAAIVWDYACENGLVASTDELKVLAKFNWGSLWIHVPFISSKNTTVTAKAFPAPSFVCLDDVLAFSSRRMYLTMNDFTWAMQ